MKKILVTTICIFLISSVVLAQARAPKAKSNAVKPNAGIACGSDPILPTDGSELQDFVASGTPSWYLVNLKTGHSYSVEVWDPIDGTIIAGSASLALIAADCTTTATTSDVTNIDPDLRGTFGARISWIQAADASAFVQVSTSDALGNSYTIRVTDTTLVNPRWSTFSGFSTQYALVNNTSVAITGTLTLYDNTGVVVVSHPILVPASEEAFQSIATPANKFGFATFAYVGPAGAVTADAYFINSTATVIVPSTFNPRNFQH
jgi:hypothetical protein